MRRLIAFSCLAVLATQGCATQKQADNLTVVQPARLRKIAAEDRERLAGIDSPRHLSHTFAGVDVTGEDPLDAFGDIVWSFPMRLYRFSNGNTPLKWAKAMEDTKSADNRREGILELANNRFARKNPYTKRYEQIGGRDAEYLVRAAAIRALNYSRSREGTGLFITGLNDSEAPVRVEAAKALANIPVESAVPKLIELLRTDENKDVRIACADALRNFRTLDVARALTSVMLDRDFAVSWQARQSLILMTGRDYRYDEGAWLDYMSKAATPFI
jgi:hypothetical protein